MGVLDDAIREHLDLKRRHGVEEEELRRQEAEALGPARREVAPADTEDGEQAEAGAAHDGEPVLSEAVAEEQPAAEPQDEAPPEPEAVAPPEPEPEPELEPEPEPQPEPKELAFEDDEDEDERARASDTPTQGFEAVGYDENDDEPFDEEDDEGEGEASTDDADVLEDTPDFLQETPEHDRLWFEQKPPRDFDFD